jgi:hypothetical protein
MSEQYTMNMADELRRLQDEHDQAVANQQSLLHDWIQRYRNPEQAPHFDAVFSDHGNQESANQFLKAMRAAKVNAPMLAASNYSGPGGQPDLTFEQHA